MKTLKITPNSLIVTEAFKTVLLSSIESEDIELKTTKDKLLHVVERFNSEHVHPYNTRHHKTERALFIDWLQGGALNIPNQGYSENYYYMEFLNAFGLQVTLEQAGGMFYKSLYKALASLLKAYDIKLIK